MPWLWIVGAVAVAELAAVVVLAVLLTRARREHEQLVRSLHVQPGTGVRAGAQKAVQLAVQTASRLRTGGVTGLVLGSLDDVVRWAREDRSEIVRVATPDGVITFVFTDIVDSTATNERIGDRAWLRVLQAHEGIVRDRVGRHGGHIVKSQGDGFMIVFGAPETALRAAVEIQTALSVSPPRALRTTPVRVRTGLHVGTALARDGDYFGRNVALAARVAAEAGGGEILISDETWNALPDRDALTVAAVRDVELKGFSGTQRLRAIAWA